MAKATPQFEMELRKDKYVLKVVDDQGCQTFLLLSKEHLNDLAAFILRGTQ